MNIQWILMSIHEYFLLANLKLGGRSLLEGTGGQRGCRVKLTLRVPSCYKRLKKFLLLWNDSTFSSLFIRLQRGTAGYGVLW